MIRQTIPSSCNIVLSTIAAAILILGASSHTIGQSTYKAGDRVECETTGTGRFWSKGTIMAFQPGDFPSGMQPDGTWYRFKADSNKVEYPCKPEFIRPIEGGNAAVKQTPTKPANIFTAANTKDPVQGTATFLECPIKQRQVKNGAAPNAELFKKIVRCKKGEKAVDEGDEGAVRVDVTAMQIGASRPWRYSQDSGNGKVGTLVHPVKTTFTVRTYYRNASEVEEGAIRILNFYVNAFGEWQIGSEELVRGGKASRIPTN